MKARGSTVDKTGWKVDLTNMQVLKDGKVIIKLKDVSGKGNNNSNNNMKMVKAKAVKDDSGHWYVIPEELLSDFYNDVEDYEFIESGEFDNLYGRYRTGGDLNNIQLYANIKD